MNEARYRELFEGFADGSLGEAECRELLDAFAGDADLKARFVDEMGTTNLLHGLPLTEGFAEERRKILLSLSYGRRAPDVSSAVVTRLRRTRRRGVFLKVFTSGVAASIVALLAWLRPWEEPPATLARVAHAADARWAAGTPVSGELGPGRVELVSGSARLDFARGARVMLEAPAVLELKSSQAVHLHEGALVAHVTPESVGFRVDTDTLALTDLGTTFGVSADAGKGTDVAVFEGRVSLAPPGEGQAAGKVFKEGEAARAASGARKIRKIPWSQARVKPLSEQPGWSLLFGVLKMSESMRFYEGRPILNPARVMDEEAIFLFPERMNLVSEAEVNVTFTAPGTYSGDGWRKWSEPFALRGRRVNTYLIQSNWPKNKRIYKIRNYIGEITFDGPVLAVIVSAERLKGTDKILGKPRYRYAYPIYRGLDGEDMLTLTGDRRTLRIHWRTSAGVDQIRVLVDAGGASGGARPGR